MREYKFRGKRKDTGEWVFGYYWCRANCEHRIYTGNLITIYNCVNPKKQKLIDEEFEVIPETVGQWTGLVDKNGVEIWENDIVSKNLIVLFEDGAFIVKEPTSFGQTRRHLCHVCENVKVIGNVYDNKELLEA